MPGHMWPCARPTPPPPPEDNGHAVCCDRPGRGARLLQQRGVLRLAYGRIEVLDRSGLEAAARLSPAELRILQRWGADEPSA